MICVEASPRSEVIDETTRHVPTTRPRELVIGKRLPSKGATEHRDLRTGQTLWESMGGLRRSGLPLERPCDTDVVIVGAGVSGAMVAEALSAAGLQVVVLDRRGPCLGSTAASTALLQFEIDTPLLLLSRKIGAKKAARAWLRSASAVVDLIRRTRKLRIRCDLRQRSTLYLAGDVLGARDLQREVALRGAIGLPSRYLDRGETLKRSGIDRRGAILSSGAAEADPIRLSEGFLRSAVRRGARVFSPVEVTEVHVGARRVEAATRDGIPVSARFLVYATGYELPPAIPSNGHAVHSTFVISTKRQREKLWKTRDLVWEASAPYLYVRTTVDGRVIAGGEDEPFEDEAKRDALLGRKSRRISTKLARLRPELDPTPDLRWTGCFGSSDSGLPTIGEIPGMKRCFAVLGYGGNGITFSALAAQLVQRAICGENDRDADLFAFR